MLREEQIDIRRQRARAEGLLVENLGKNRVFSDFRVTNPKTKGQYRVSIRGFEINENNCECPDFKSNTLGTCKHIEAVLDFVGDELPAHVRMRKAPVTQPEIHLRYGEQLTLGLRLPPRHTDALERLARTYFDETGTWKAGDRQAELVKAVDEVPERVTIFSDALDFIDREVERKEMAAREADLLAEIPAVARGAVSEGSLLVGLLQVPLYEYQLRGAVFAACRGRSILGDDMGLGKTVQAMAAVELLARLRGISRVLVVSPASVKYQWEAEIRKFTHRPVQVIEGGPRRRRRQYAAATFYRLVNYEQVLKDLDVLNDWSPDLIVLDEAQRIKNWESKISRAVKKLRSRYALVLTGTPLENRLEELYSIVQFVDDRRLGPAFQFLHDHRQIDDQGRLVGYRNLDAIRERLTPILLRRTRDEVLSELPTRSDTTRYVEMSPEQRQPYEEQRAALARLTARRVLSDLDRKRILSIIANLRMLCNSTYLFDKQTDVSPKLDEFAELAQELSEAGHKAVVFSQWETMLSRAAERLDRLGLGYVILHGAVPGKDRYELVERFRTDPSCRIFLSTDAGGSGLNLQAGDTVINLEVPWNPAVWEQRIARVHRMGQARPVRVINLVTRGSIEERVLRAVAMKQSLFAGVFDQASDSVAMDTTSPADLLTDVRELLSDPEEHAERGTRNAERGAMGSQPTAMEDSPNSEVWEAAVSMIEALGRVPELRVPREVRERLLRALERLGDETTTRPDH